MEFHSPVAFLLLVFVPLLLDDSLQRTLLKRLGIDLKALGPRAFRFSTPVPMNKLKPPLRQRIAGPLLSGLRLSAFVFLVTAIARPQSGTRYSEVESSGRDIMLALDVSGSMRGLDFSLGGRRASRLEALKDVVSEFVKRRSNDRLGLVIFGTEAFTQCPLTRDHRTLLSFVAALEIGMAGDQTAIGNSIAVALKRMKDIPSESKVIVLVTDGRQTVDSLSPRLAAEAAKEQGVKVYCIGIGGNKPVPFPVQGVFGTTIVENRDIYLDEATLRQIASITGARYFNAQNTEELQAVCQEIDRLEERSEKALEYVDYEELYLPFALLALAFFLGHELLAASIFSILP